MYFLALDESLEKERKILGCSVIPLNRVSEFEKAFVELRIKNKVFGEVKWTCISSSYLNKYEDFLNLFFDNDYTSFHSICYRNDRFRFNAGYYLIRTICWKLWNAGKRGPLFILFDNTEGFGVTGTEHIKREALNDPLFHSEIYFCNQGVSHVLGLLQVTDLITGAVATVENKVRVRSSKRHICELIKKKNDNIPINLRLLNLPKLSDRKIQFFDPNDNPLG